MIKEFGNIELNCLSIKKVESKLLNILTKELNRGKGEAEVIGLSYETGLSALIDDLKARRVASDLGLTVIGTIGLLMKTQKLGIIDSAVEKIRELKRKGFYIPEELIEKITRFKF